MSAAGHWTSIPLLPGGTGDIVQNVHLRRVRTICSRPVDAAIDRA